MSAEMKYGQGPFDPAYLPRWEFREGGTSVLPNAGTVTLAPPLTDPVTNILQLAVDGGPVTYALNGAVANNVSPGWIPEDGREIIGPLHDFRQITIFAQAAANVHYQWFREHS